MSSVKDLGEDALIERLLGRILSKNQSGRVIAGPGDDCAVVTSGREGFFELLKTDCLVEGVHFLQGTKPERVGRKAICRAVSDVAAMGGIPQFVLVTLALGSSCEIAAVEGWYAGMGDAAEEFDIEIVGGETSSLPGERGAVISISMTGEVEKENCVYRSGARVGDVIAVTGRLGESFLSERHLTFVPRLEEARWMVKQSHKCRPTSMMDLSDGLAKDLPRLLKADGLGYCIDRNRIPVNEGADLRSAINEGEDYELLMTFSSLDLAEWNAAFPETLLTAIGEVTEKTEAPMDEGGWDHFKR